MSDSLDPATTFVLDTSAVINGRVSAELRDGGFRGALLVIPETVLAELEILAAEGRETGLAGLAEVHRVRELAEAAGGRVRVDGEWPRGRLADLKASRSIDADARRLAGGLGATVVTSDPVQELACAAHGVAVRVLGPSDRAADDLRLMAYFDDETMSVHLRARTRPRAKRGTPGNMKVVPVSEEILDERTLDELAREIVEVAERHPDGFIESDAGGSTVVQLANLRISIARPPFSDAFEITAVRPVARTVLDDYEWADLLRERFADRHRGVLVAGAPGAGKSTFVSAVAGHLETAGWVIKTMEKPRDLVVSDEITQYTALEGDMANTADVLLLVRPDFTIYDEMRRTPDFQVFADMRLAGVGMIGVVHATRGIDALQRLVGRVELGMIPQIVDTVVFIGDGDVKEIFEVGLTVRTPTGMFDEGLARPIIEVTDYSTGRLAFEIYTFAQQVVVMPIGDVVARKPLWALAERYLATEMRRMVRGSVEVVMLADDAVAVYVPDDEIGAVIGRGGAIVRELEERYRLRFDVRPIEERPRSAGRQSAVDEPPGRGGRQPDSMARTGGRQNKRDKRR